jgi:hypothetical protein
VKKSLMPLSGSVLDLSVSARRRGNSSNGVASFWDSASAANVFAVIRLEKEEEGCFTRHFDRQVISERHLQPDWKNKRVAAVRLSKINRDVAVEKDFGWTVALSQGIAR